jgi:hypothetical protein
MIRRPEDLPYSDELYPMEEEIKEDRNPGTFKMTDDAHFWFHLEYRSITYPKINTFFVANQKILNFCKKSAILNFAAVFNF